MPRGDLNGVINPSDNTGVDGVESVSETVLDSGLELGDATAQQSIAQVSLPEEQVEQVTDDTQYVSDEVIEDDNSYEDTNVTASASTKLFFAFSLIYEVSSTFFLELTSGLTNSRLGRSLTNLFSGNESEGNESSLLQRAVLIMKRIGSGLIAFASTSVEYMSVIFRQIFESTRSSLTFIYRLALLLLKVILFISINILLFIVSIFTSIYSTFTPKEL